jgi:hypothetical protein
MRLAYAKQPSIFAPCSMGLSRMMADFFLYQWQSSVYNFFTRIIR